ncbi:MAG: nucleoside triphosphate pyrophosphohydrolase [Chitinophagales bacterium]|nr:nucleoside triphosphate pyrophosphohydrolase [Chitinophagales bacterium]
MNPKREKTLEAFSKLLDIMDDLRAKCPWDMKQTFESLSLLTIEEVYELNDAIIEKDYKNISEEIGDLLLHMVFYAKLGEEIQAFDMASSIEAINKKLIDRHPHIYGDVIAEDEAAVKRNWEKLKMKEGRSSILEGVPKSLSSIVKAYRIQEKVKQVGFEWENIDQVWDKVEEERAELLQAVQERDQAHIEEEFGDLLFALINYARFAKIDPEAALQKTNRKFIQRFKYIEEHAPKSLDEMSLEEMDALWNRAKKV